MTIEQAPSCGAGLMAIALLWPAAARAKRRKQRGEAEAPTPVRWRRGARRRSIGWSPPTRFSIPSIRPTSLPKISAPVRRVLVNRGDHVQAGQLLAELESARSGGGGEREQAASIEQAQAAYQTIDRRHGAGRQDQSAGRCAVRAADARRGEEALRQPRRRCRSEGALAQKLVDDAKVAMVQAQSQLETAQRHLEASEPGEPARSDAQARRRR